LDIFVRRCTVKRFRVEGEVLPQRNVDEWTDAERAVHSNIETAPP
jgi:hypothetical protein